MVMGSDEEAGSDQSSDNLVTSDWFAECLLFLEIKLTAVQERENETRSKKGLCSAGLKKNSGLGENKLCFVQWHEILDCQ